VSSGRRLVGAIAVKDGDAPESATDFRAASG